MEIRIKYSKGTPFVMIIQSPEDRFLDTEKAIKECIDELAELVNSIKNEDMEEQRMFDAKDMLADYEIFCRQKLELFNVLIKVDLGMINRADLVIPVGLIEKTYKAMDDYTKCLGLSLNLLGVELPDID